FRAPTTQDHGKPPRSWVKRTIFQHPMTQDHGRLPSREHPYARAPAGGGDFGHTDIFTSGPSYADAGAGTRLTRPSLGTRIREGRWPGGGDDVDGVARFHPMGTPPCSEQPREIPARGARKRDPWRRPKRLRS